MLQIYNTFTQKKEIFKPLVSGEISLYVCGITVYDYCHLGHARVFVAFDAIVRFLRASGWKVKYVRNITDIDDKIIKRAHENNEPMEALTARFITAMDEDTKALNALPPDMEPRATHHMPKILNMIEALHQKDFAYVANNGDVYFAVDHFSRYGELSHKDLDKLDVGHRVEVISEKHTPLDFVLWKQAKPEEPHWDSPWGPGRPGWHIECSAMSTALLGDTFDIHGGGSDLTFPHHENERAQSECATGKPFVNYWMHVGFVVVNKEKMSKSLNNFFTIRGILEQYDAEVVRYFLLASHYRSPVNYATDQSDQAKSSLERLYTSLRAIEISQVEIAEDSPFKKSFFDAMNDDFNTPVALSVLFELAHKLNTARENQEDKEAQVLAGALKYLGNVLGLLERDPQSFLQGKQGGDLEIEQLIAEREKARAAKEWARSDSLRQQLTDKGIVLEDTANGTIWRRA